MSLDLGTLVAKLGVDDGPLGEGLARGLDKFKESGGQLTKLAAGIGAAAAIALGTALMGAMAQQDVGAKVAAQIGGGSEAAARYGKLAGHIYADNFGESLDAIGEAIKSIQANHLLAEDSTDADLQRITERALTLTDVFGQDMPRVTQAVSQMLRTGLVSSADEAFDVLTRGMQQGVDKSEDLLDTFNEYPVQFRKLGLSGTQTMGLLSQAIRAGARDSDTAADALKEFAIRAVDGSTLSAQGFKALGLDARKMTAQIAQGGPQASAGLQTVLDRLRAMKDPVAQSAAATALFGTKAEDLGAALFAMDPSHAVAAMGKVAGATEEAGKTASNTASGNLETLRRQLQVGFVDLLGGKVLPPVMALTHWLADNLGPAAHSLAGWMRENKDVLEPLGIALSTVVGVILAVAAATKTWAAIQAILDLELWANPIGLIILAVIALIAVIVWIATKTTWFETAWRVSWNAIKEAAHAVADWFMNDFVGSFVRDYQRLMHAASEAGAWISGRWDALIAFLTSIPARVRRAASGMWDGVKDAFKSAINWIINKWNGLHFGLPRIDTHLPGVGVIGGVTFRVPQIPQLAAGGIVRATPGGRVVNVAEGGQDEAITPLSRLRDLLGGRLTGTLKVDTGGDPVLDLLFRLIRAKISAEYGGDVDVAFAGA